MTKDLLRVWVVGDLIPTKRKATMRSVVAAAVIGSAAAFAPAALPTLGRQATRTFPCPSCELCSFVFLWCSGGSRVVHVL